MLERWEIFVANRFNLHSLPQILEQIVVCQARRHLTDSSTCQIRGTEFPGGPAGVVFGLHLNQKQVLVDLAQHAYQESLVTLAGELAVAPLLEHASRKEFDQAKDLVALAFADSLDRRLFAVICPSVEHGDNLGLHGALR